YLLGIRGALVTARLMRRFWFKADETPFVMELPPYRLPTIKATLRNMWSKAEQYLRKMGGLILVASIIIWALSYFPRYNSSQVPAEYEHEILTEVSCTDNENLSETEKEELVLNAYQQEHSILGYIGKTVEPIVSPMDFDWKTSVSLLAGAAAKEVVVSTLGVLYVGEDNEQLISERLTTPSPTTGKAPFTPASALAFMVFVLLYFPCIATLSAIARECDSWKYAAFSALYNTAVAWVLSFIVFRIALLF
ncbi:MAG: ferrous iron transport protein B, partial [Muribaculaceae bacterium]|nr:ferrous iron transport protein B [Muribaculaceae bacterium]